MKLKIEKEIIHKVQFKSYNAFSNPPEMQSRELPIYEGKIQGLNTNLKHLIIASDLQGIIKKEGKNYQLSESLIEEILNLQKKNKIEIDFNSTGIILCGDLYSEENKRKGVYGDVRSIWRKYNSTFQFVVGVAGNHDSFGNEDEIKKFKEEKAIHFLDNEITTIENIKFGGLSGMIGKPTKNQRKEKVEYLSNLKKLLHSNCDFILLHEGPNCRENKIRGNEFIRQVIEENQTKNYVLFGHRNWKDLFLSKIGLVSLLNADNKCLILKIDS